MRRALRRLTVGTAATSIALLSLPPAFAEGGVDLDLGDDGGSANVKVEVKDLSLIHISEPTRLL